MRYSRDPAKSEEDVRRRGFDFRFAARIFDDFCLELPDSRFDYGEARIVALGMFDQRNLTVVFADRIDSDGELTRRIISARPSNRREQRAYAEATEVR